MAEPGSGASSSAVPKEKNSLLDKDIGNEFLSSWKSMSLTEDGAMDFNFETAEKGKKKAFNFGNLNMDFTLDGDFDKITSSFKVDMPDLDFSCPPKKNPKPKDRSEEESTSVNRQGKQDRFAFSFDFNELDDFNFDSSLTKGDKKSNKCSDSKGINSDRSECQDSKIYLAEGVSAIDDSTLKLPALESVTTSKADTLKCGRGNLSYKNDDTPSKSATFGNLVVPLGANTLPEQTIITSTGETEQQSQPPPNIISTKPYAQQIIQDLSVQPVSENDLTRDTVSEEHTEVCVMDMKLNSSSGGEQSKIILGSGSNLENSQLKNSPPLHSKEPQNNNNDRKKLGSDDHVPVENVDGSKPAQGDLDLEDASITSVSRKMMTDTKADRENQNSTSKLLLAPLSSGPMVEKLTPVKEKETVSIRSKFFKRSEETECQLHQASSTGTKLILSDSKRSGTMHASPADEKREGSDAIGTQAGSKMVGNSRSHAGGLTEGEPVLLGIEKNAKDFNNFREGSNAVGAQNGSKLVGKSRQHDKEVTDGEPVLVGSENNIDNHNTIGFLVNPSSLSGQTTKSSTQKCVNPKLVVSSMASIQNSKIISVGGNKLTSLKVARRTSDLSSLKISRSVGGNNDPSNLTFLKEIESLRNSQQNVKVPGSPASKMLHSVGTGKQTPLTPSLKRKTFEASSADLTLNPLKRLSESSSESRNKEASERVIEEQVCNHETLIDSDIKNSLCDRPTYPLDIPREVNMTELEIPLVMENDGNVEKAEAYTKELEDICNMLKKKHEEAKELFVRAIVNNNNLLMLNHPIYEEKISFHFSSLLHSSFI
ncbi:hypothetical protein L1049_021505 [Liquidambar formosana]|uniref:Uncharacterized protein n=1 Tax=Liquidambar formosana TaxID=63359 RepID=A0AAP0R469_LIQFO